MNINTIKDNLNKTGIIKISDSINSDLLEKLKEECDKIVLNSRKGKIEHVRIYRNYFNFNKLNVFGIDFPFNYQFTKNLYNYFNELNIKDQILEIFDWKNFNTTVARLHTNSNFFKYQGEWHRDDNKYPSPNSFQCIIYLDDEKGFRIVPKNKNSILKTFGFNTDGNNSNKTLGFIELPESIYEVVDAKKGDIVIFESGLLHQGYVCGERLHLHLRFEKSDLQIFNEDNRFNLIDKLLPNYDLNKEKINHDYLNFSIKNSILRIKNLILYFLPRFKYIYRNLFEKNKSSILQSSFWQKKI